MDTKKFKELYDTCFDENNNIKACGRENCKKLIKFLGGQPYGDPETGYMHVKEIIKLYNFTNAAGQEAPTS